MVDRALRLFSAVGVVGVIHIEHAGRDLYRLIHTTTGLEFPVEFTMPLNAIAAASPVNALADWDQYVADVKINEHAREHELWLAILNIANEYGGNRIGSTHNCCLDWQRIKLRERRKEESDAVAE